eukprot:m.42748 g.42748  ORF g.42748 m.42748 type:complete len:181 (+) comp12135_c0_seq1:93-635(+)
MAAIPSSLEEYEEEQRKQAVRSTLAKAASSAALERPESASDAASSPPKPGNGAQAGDRCKECRGELDSRRVFHKIGSAFYHQNCMTCNFCNDGLAGRKFALIGERLCCKDCQAKEMGRICTKCGKAIMPDASGVAKAKTVDNQRYHLECFKCFKCSTQLHSQFLPKNGKLFCVACAVTSD